MTGSQAPALPQSWLSLQWLPWSLGSPHLKGQRSLSLFHSTRQKSNTFLGPTESFLTLVPVCAEASPCTLSARTPGPSPHLAVLNSATPLWRD